MCLLYNRYPAVWHCAYVKKSKGKFLYSAVSSPQDRSKTCSPSRLLWEASSHMLQFMREGCSYTYPPLSIARYSFLFSWVNWSNVEWKKIAQGFNPAARIRTRVLVVESLKLYPWATALYICVCLCFRQGLYGAVCGQHAACPGAVPHWAGRDVCHRLLLPQGLEWRVPASSGRLPLLPGLQLPRWVPPQVRLPCVHFSST